MIEYSSHAKTKWLIRGDVNRHIGQAWDCGIKVECPHQFYDEARLDPETSTILLCSKGTISTVLSIYRGTTYRFKFPVECYDCGQHHHNPDTCPSCGSSQWRCR